MIAADRKRHERKRMAAYGVGAVCAALFAYALVANAGEQDIELLDVSDEPAVRSVFFGGEPRFGLCLDTAPTPGEVPGVFSSAAADLRGVCKAVALNCSEKLPGGRTVHERFRFNASASPVAFFVANGDRPRQIRITIDQDHRPLVEKLRKRSQPRVMSVKSSRDLNSACSRPLCALFMHEGPIPPHERQALTRYASKHRRCEPARARARRARPLTVPPSAPLHSVGFAHLNASRLGTSMDRVLPALNEGESHLVLFHTRKGSEGRDIFARAFRGDAAQPLLAARESATHPLEDGTTVSLSDFLTLAAESVKKPRRADNDSQASSSGSGGAVEALGMKQIRAFPKVMTRSQAQRRAQRASTQPAKSATKGRAGSKATKPGQAKSGGGRTAPSRPSQRAKGQGRARSGSRPFASEAAAAKARSRAEQERRAKAEEAERAGEAAKTEGAEDTAAGRARLEEDMKDSPHVAWGAEEDEGEVKDFGDNDLGFADAEEEVDLDELDDFSA